MTTCPKCGAIGGRWDAKCRICEPEYVPLQRDPLLSLPISPASAENGRPSLPAATPVPMHSPSFAAAELIAWLDGKIADAETAVKCREDAEATWRGGTDKSWLEAGCRLTAIQRHRVADKEARIARKCRHELDMLKFARAKLEEFPAGMPAAPGDKPGIGCGPESVPKTGLRNSDATPGHAETAGETASGGPPIQRAVETELPTQPGEAVPGDGGPLFIITQTGCSTRWTLSRDAKGIIKFDIGIFSDRDYLKLSLADAEHLIRILDLHGCKIQEWKPAGGPWKALPAISKGAA